MSHWFRTWPCMTTDLACYDEEVNITGGVHGKEEGHEAPHDRNTPVPGDE